LKKTEIFWKKIIKWRRKSSINKSVKWKSRFKELIIKELQLLKKFNGEININTQTLTQLEDDQRNFIENNYLTEFLNNTEIRITKRPMRICAITDNN
jgi:hypothetical protein